MLAALDADVLAAHACWFGGGTAMALRYGEYRESVDIDFLVSDLACYRALRQLLTGPAGLGALAHAGAVLTPVRELRADQYGLRTLLREGGMAIKFEIVLEARIAFDRPGPNDVIAGVAALTPLDMAASKLLALADRWRDDGVFSRDLIDLAMMQPVKPLLRAAIAKAAAAYGDSVEASLAQAIQDLRDRPHRLDTCMGAMQINTVSKAQLWSRIKALEKRSAAGSRSPTRTRESRD
ncbi:nucleotidyl transferase AbiEii/AbiGii toxin family protein [Roseateles sp. LYH14W]|uniref:Nucleotidyl transferase AbiEii/AbiGii toxin family protein n=1 Tax=Pelomonas parva TaxID=3299032 RepID=A0ABW7F5K8_9BURK